QIVPVPVATLEELNGIPFHLGDRQYLKVPSVINVDVQHLRVDTTRYIGGAALADVRGKYLDQRDANAVLKEENKKQSEKLKSTANWKFRAIATWVILALLAVFLIVQKFNIFSP